MNPARSRTGRVFDVQRFCVHDGPGIRTTVFLAGCPLRCAWCHNPEAFSGATAESRTAEEVLAEVLLDRAYFEASGGGLTVSGGEPLLQAEFLSALLEGAGQAGLHRCVQTAGSVRWEAFASILGLVELVQFDLKHLDPVRHRALTGASNALILENARRLAETGVNVEFRLPLIPGINDDEAHLREVGAFVSELGAKALCLVPYQRSYLDKYARLGLKAALRDTVPPGPAELRAASSLFGALGLAVRVDG